MQLLNLWKSTASTVNFRILLLTSSSLLPPSSRELHSPRSMLTTGGGARGWLTPSSPASSATPSWLQSLSRQVLQHQASPLVPDFTISVYGIHINYCFVGHILASSSSSSNFCISQLGWNAMKIIEKEKRMRPLKRELHELPYTEMLNSPLHSTYT